MKNNLIEELFDKSKTYRMGILCTYTLNIEFLENYLLNLDGLANCNNLCVFTDRSIYNKMFEDGSLIRSKWANKRYLLTPIDTNGVFHPKIYILASEKAVRIGIGSANLTREGLATNLEIVSAFEITQKDKTYSVLLIECIQFIKELAEASRSISAIKSVNEFIEYIGGIIAEQKEEKIHLFHNLKQSISMQMQKCLEGQNVKEIKIISPFFDKKLKVLKEFQTLFPAADVSIFIQQGKSDFPASGYDYDNKNIKIFVYKNQERFIHGKAIIFKTNMGYFLLTGSSNFTDSAMLSQNFKANVETSLWGTISKEIADKLSKPNGHKAVLLKSLDNLIVMQLKKNDTACDKMLIYDWLIEVILLENQIQVVLRDKEGYIPSKLILNGDIEKSFDYAEKISITGINKSQIMYAQVEGTVIFGNRVKSGKVWIVNLDRDKEKYSKKRYSVNEPSQLSDILKDIILNGTEEELIDYLLKFNIPLDLVGLNFRNSGLKVMESQGNIFGELMIQKKSMLASVKTYDAINHFMVINYNKLYKHCENTQLLKLNNFMLIFSTIFSMTDTFHDFITATHKENPIEAADWSRMRDYYDLFLKYSKDCLELLWLTDEKHYSFAQAVDTEISNDGQKMLGNIKNFKEFVVVMGYDYYLLKCYRSVKNICLRINTYIKKARC